MGSATMPSRSGASVVRSEIPGGDARLEDERARCPRRSSPSCTRRRVREAAKRRDPTATDDAGGDRLRDDDRGERLGHPVLRADRDRDEPERHRERLAARPGGRSGRAGGAPSWRRSRAPGRAAAARGEQRRGEPVRRRTASRPPGRARASEPGRQRAAEELERERLPEESPKPAPVLRRDVAEAVLRQRLLDGEVEQRLEEAGGCEGRREDAEVLDAELACGDDGAEDAERAAA